MYRAGCFLAASIGMVAGQSVAPAAAPRNCQINFSSSNTCLSCPLLQEKICTSRTDFLAVNIVSTTTPKICSDLKVCTFEIPRDSIRSTTFSDPSKIVTSMSFKRAYTDGALLWIPTNLTFSNLSGLSKLEFIGDRPYNAGGVDSEKDYLEVSPNNTMFVFPTSITELTLKNTYTNSLKIQTDTQLKTLQVEGSELDGLPSTGLDNVNILTFNSHRTWKFPYEILDMSNLLLINLPNNNFTDLTFTTDAQFDKFKTLISKQRLSLPDSSFITCAKTNIVQGCPNYRASITAPPSSGPSSGAITTLVIVSCIASVLVLVAIIVHRRNRHHSDMSPGILNSNSPDDDFYGVDEAYVTTHTISKYKTAGANDASLTKIPADQIALARCLGGDIWMGEMDNNRIVLRRAPRFAGDHITDSFFQGVKEMARLSHPNLVTYMGVTCLSGTDIYAVAEFMDKGTLISVYQTMPLTWEVQLGMATDVAEALHYLHTLLPSPVPVEHLRSSNILVSNTFSCKFNIFNFMASYKSQTMCKEMYGHHQLAWRAPEVLMNEMKNFLAADIYSMGVVLAEIGTCTRPFDREIGEVGTVHTDVWIVDSVMAGKGVPTPYDSKSPKWTNLPEDYQKLVKACLSASPSQRPNSGIILQRLKALKKEGIEL